MVTRFTKFHAKNKRKVEGELKMAQESVNEIEQNKRELENIITRKDKDISEKALHLSLQKIYSHKQGNNHSLDRSEVAGSGNGFVFFHQSVHC